MTDDRYSFYSAPVSARRRKQDAVVQLSWFAQNLPQSSKASWKNPGPINEHRPFQYMVEW